MKEKMKLILILLIIIIASYMIDKQLIKAHEVEYKINNYQIIENFHLENKEHRYELVIKNNNQIYSYILKENLNKQKKIIKDIKIYKEENITCILPIYKKDINTNLYCNNGEEQLSNYYLKDNVEYQKILKKVKKYNLSYQNNESGIEEYKKIKIYKDNIKDNNIITIWDYKGIYILKNNSFSYQKILNYDLYDNIMSTVISNYFVLFENTSVNGIENIYYYDLKKDKLKKFKLKENLSKESYINGIHDSLIYVTDKKKKVQYTINIKKEVIEEIGTEENGYIKYSNNKKEILNKSDFFMKEQFFSNENIQNNKITKNDELKKERNLYYFVENNKMYKANEKGYKELLFELENINEWNVINDEIFLISNDTLYLYSDNDGLNKLVKSNEFKYNYKNICKLLN